MCGEAPAECACSAFAASSHRPRAGAAANGGQGAGDGPARGQGVAATGDSISGTFSKIGYRSVCDSRSQVLVGGECVGRN